MGIHNIQEANGLGLLLTGMTIVFVGLVLVTMFIAIVPRAIRFAEQSRRKVVRKAPAHAVADVVADATAVLDSALLAAVGFVIQAEMENQSLSEFQRITIQRDEKQQVWAVAGKMRTLSTRM